MSTEQYKSGLHIRLIAQRRSELRESNFGSHRSHHRSGRETAQPPPINGPVTCTTRLRSSI